MDALDTLQALLIQLLDEVVDSLFGLAEADGARLLGAFSL